MKIKLLEYLVCPIDNLDIELVIFDNDRIITMDQHKTFSKEETNQEIISGLLINNRLKIMYPIIKGVPRMLTFKNPIIDLFQEKFDKILNQKFENYSFPDEPPSFGEKDVLRTFSSEWINYDWDNESYWSLSADMMYKTMNYSLDLDSFPINNKLVLEVGTGIGATANHISKTNDCQLIGVDLSFAIDVAYHHFSKNINLHLIQASAFRLPFRKSIFDLVYSFGVLHHTYSTEKAFNSVSSLTKKNGKFFLWVYSLSNESRTFTRKIFYTIEKIIRPFIWRLPEKLQTFVLLPFIPLYIIFQNYIREKDEKGLTKYSWREAEHAARDKFTPRFAHRHTPEEVNEWYINNGYDNIRFLSDRPKEKWLPDGLVECIGVEGFKL